MQSDFKPIALSNCACSVRRARIIRWWPAMICRRVIGWSWAQWKTQMASGGLPMLPRLTPSTVFIALNDCHNASEELQVASWLALKEGFGRILQMPRRELKDPRQVEDWLVEMSQQLTEPGEMILIGSGGLLWHAFQKGITEPLPENSMDVDPITDSDEIARLCYAAVIGSEFEQKHGWHVNLMPGWVLREF